MYHLKLTTDCFIMFANFEVSRVTHRTQNLAIFPVASQDLDWYSKSTVTRHTRAKCPSFEDWNLDIVACAYAHLRVRCPATIIVQTPPYPV